ncbi:MAG: stage V sporulation protein AD [Clostridiales bacterium]|jgi:stage V sporulation protein AD|nr:stage V sporulation protein AD [Clostridiales bacterium]
MQPTFPTQCGRAFYLTQPVYIVGHSATVGGKEAESILKPYIKRRIADPKYGQKTFEKAEALLFLDTVRDALKEAALSPRQIDLFLAGDLLNQIVSSAYTARELSIPYLGLYGACSTMAESLLVGSMLVSAGFARRAVCATGSHFATAERQYRGPLELGCQRQPYAQWTVTGCGADVLAREGDGVRVTGGIVGRVVDYGVNDVANMGAAMAPAACDALHAFFTETDTAPGDYDMIVTGDLGKLGSDILRHLMQEKGITLGQNYIDCGNIIFDAGQDAAQGGSGCGCAAVVLNTYLMSKLQAGEYKKVLFFATGALMSLTSTQQGETIPGIAHGVLLECPETISLEKEPT